MPDRPAVPLPERLLIRVPLNAEALARGLMHFIRAATEHGLTEAEVEEASVFVRRSGVLVAADLDQGISRTADGRARPFRLRFALPTFPGSESEGPAEMAGAVVRMHDLLEVLRRRVVTGSWNDSGDERGSIGLLPGDAPVFLEAIATGDVQQAAAHEVATGPGAAALAVAHLIVRPPEGIGQKPRLVRVRRPAAPTQFEQVEPQAIAGYLPNLDTEALIEAAGVAHPNAGVLLQAAPNEGPGYVVAVGSAGAIIETFRAPQRGGPDLLAVVDAALPDTSHEVTPRPLSGPVVLSTRLSETVGFLQDSVEEVAKDSQRESNERADVAVAIAAVAAAITTAPEAVRAALLSDRSAKKAAQSTEATPSSPRAEAERLLALVDGKPLGRAQAALAALPAAAAGAFWEEYEQQLEAMGVPGEARRHLLLGVGQAPTAAALRIRQSVKDQWMSERTAPVRGALWAGTDGRVHGGYQHETFGTFSVSDLAVRPDPRDYPATPQDVAIAIARGGAGAFAAQLYSSDLAHAGNAVIGLTNLARARRQRATAGQSSATLFVARWTPDGASRDLVAPMLPADDRSPTDTSTVWLGEGREAERLVVGRKPREREVQGTLTVFGFEQGGERVHLRMPIKAVVSGAAVPMAAAMDAEQLRALLGFVARKGVVSVLEVTDGTVRLTTMERTRVSVVPTLGQTQAPEVLRPLLAAAGVPVSSDRTVAQRAMIERARALGPRRAEPAALQAEARVTSLPGPSVVLRPAPGGALTRADAAGPAVGVMFDVSHSVTRLLREAVERSAKGKSSWSEVASGVIATLLAPGTDRAERCGAACDMATRMLREIDARLESLTLEALEVEHRVALAALRSDTQRQAHLAALITHAKQRRGPLLRRQRFWTTVLDAATQFAPTQAQAAVDMQERMRDRMQELLLQPSLFDGMDPPEPAPISTSMGRAARA